MTVPVSKNVPSEVACALPMPPHRITWLLEQESVKGVFSCEAEPGGKCRLVCAADCGSEVWPCGGGGEDEDEGESKHVQHPMHDGGECQVVLFLTLGDAGAAALYDGEPTELRNALIESQWEYDYYSWTYVPVLPGADR